MADEKPYDEQAFRAWYSSHAAKLGLNPNPDDPRHHYDYRAAYRAGASPDKKGHWPSQFKAPDHPNRYVDGIDTITGLPELKLPDEGPENLEERAEWAKNRMEQRQRERENETLLPTEGAEESVAYQPYRESAWWNYYDKKTGVQRGGRSKEWPPSEKEKEEFDWKKEYNPIPPAPPSSPEPPKEAAPAPPKPVPKPPTEKLPTPHLVEPIPEEDLPPAPEPTEPPKTPEEQVEERGRDRAAARKRRLGQLPPLPGADFSAAWETEQGIGGAGAGAAAQPAPEIAEMKRMLEEILEVVKEIKDNPAPAKFG